LIQTFIIFRYNKPMTNYETVVGLEIHAHLSTESKMFCPCGTGPKGKEYSVSEKDKPNVRICPICSGQPGTLPVPNKKAIEDTILLGLALGSKINPKFNFERKNYYYPDLPKAYQITSATNPPVIGGSLRIMYQSQEESFDKVVNLEHIHLEEDAGKLTHESSGESSLVDLNRAGTPLLEIITKPELSSGNEAVVFMSELQAILRTLGISDADMEKGQMRCDANISIRKVGSKELGTKVEIKNINSFKMVKKAIEYEEHRQEEVLSEGEKLIQETRGWDDSKGKTTSQRSKEFANDYRYFPEPDIPPITTGSSTEFDPLIIEKRIKELPESKRNRFVKDYGLSEHDAHNLSVDPIRSDFFEETVKYAKGYGKDKNNKAEIAKLASNFMTDALFTEQKITSKRLSELIDIVMKGDISLKIAKEILPEMMKGEKAAKSIIEQKGYSQISNETELNNIVTQILLENKKMVEDYHAGKTQLFGYFVGQIMAKTKGQANPGMVNELLKKKLEG